MTIKELIFKGSRIYLAWVSQKVTIDRCDIIKSLMKQAANSRNADEVNFIQEHANAYLAELYVSGNDNIVFSTEEMAYNNVTFYLPAIKNKHWVDFNDNIMQKQSNYLDMLNGCLNRICIRESESEIRELFTSALFYIREIIDISRERALEAEYGPKAERDAQLADQLTNMFTDF